MTRKFCDRCGKECESLIEIHIPLENHGNGRFSVEEKEVCGECNEIHNKLVETLTDIRFMMYKNLFELKGTNNERDHKKAD